MAELIFALACKEWADRMTALASYGRQANDQTLVHMAMKIQARAIRKAGELLRQIDARGDHMKKGSASLSRTAVATAAGLSDDQRKQAIRVASIPEDEFEAAIESDDPVTVTELAECETVRRTISDRA